MPAVAAETFWKSRAETLTPEQLAILELEFQGFLRIVGAMHRAGVKILAGSDAPARRCADLVLLNANPLTDIRHTLKIQAVVLGGRFLDRTALDDLLAQAEAAAKRSKGCYRSNAA